VTPSERACLTAVVRYQTLVNARTTAANPELAHLRTFLSSSAPDAWQEADDRRRWRRFDTKIEASTRIGGITSRCTLLDVGAGGLRVRNDARLSLQTGDNLVVSVDAGAASLRIDLPAKIRHVEADGGAFGIEFVGAPLMMHQRNAARSGRFKRPPGGETGSCTAEVPMARSSTTKRDIAA
jgi:hypothetical protein